MNSGSPIDKVQDKWQQSIWAQFQASEQASSLAECPGTEQGSSIPRIHNCPHLHHLSWMTVIETWDPLAKWKTRQQDAHSGHHLSASGAASEFCENFHGIKAEQKYSSFSSWPCLPNAYMCIKFSLGPEKMHP